MKGPIATRTISTSFVLGLRLILQAATLVLLTRTLGPGGFGAYAGVAALAVLFGTLSSFGTHLILLGEMSKDSSRRAEVLRYGVPVTLSCGTVSLLVYLLIGVFAFREMSISFGVFLSVGLAEILLQPLFVMPATEHLALGRTARSQLWLNLPLSLRVLAAYAVYLLQPLDPLAVFGFGYLAAALLSLFIATSRMQASWPAISSWRWPTSQELRIATGHSVLSITASAPSELDKVLATKLLQLTDSGLYASAARMMGAATLPVVALMLSALPRLFRDGINHSIQSTRFLRWVFAAALIYSVILSLVMWLISPVFVWLFGTEYVGIELMIFWLCFAMPGMALRLVAGSVLLAIGRPWMRTGFEVLGIVVLVIAAAILTGGLGTIGMPIALACSEWTMACVGAALIIKARSRTAVTSKGV